MLVCRSCGSSKIRSGYHPPPLPLRLLFVRTVLCDHCNAQYRAFLLRAPDTGRERRKSHQTTESFNPTQSSIDLNRLNQSVAATARASDERKERSLNLTIMTENSKPADSAPGFKHPATTAEKHSTDSDSAEESKIVSLRQKSCPPCPRCQSVHTRRRHRNSLERFFLLFTDNRPFACEACGKRFYAQKPLDENGLEADDK